MKKIYLIFITIFFVILSIICILRIIVLRENIRVINQENKMQNYIISILEKEISFQKSEMQLLRENQSLFQTTQSSNPNLLSALSTMTNLSRFQPDFLPIQSSYAISQEYTINHQSIDLSAPRGTKVFSSAAGIVVACYEDKNLGNVILIDHLNSYKTLYAHLDQFRVSVNTFLEKGQEIGTVGSSGNSTNPHLHFQIYKDNDPIDPNTLIKIPKFKN